MIVSLRVSGDVGNHPGEPSTRENMYGNTSVHPHYNVKLVHVSYIQYNCRLKLEGLPYWQVYVKLL
jgi:hypothetical protein